MQPLFGDDGEVVGGVPELLVRVLGVHHGVELRELRQRPVEQQLLAVDGVALEASVVERRRHALQRLHIVSHLVDVRQLQARKRPSMHINCKREAQLSPSDRRDASCQ